MKTDGSGKPIKEKLTPFGEEIYRSLIDQSVEMVYLHDTEGQILEVNRAAIKWTGYTKEELLSMNVFDLHPYTEGRENVIREWKNWRAGIDNITLEFEHRRKDGKLLPVEISTGKVIVGKHELMLALVRDVSERREAAKIIEESRNWYRALAEDIPVLITRVSPEGIITYVNKASAEIIGLPPEEITGSDFFSFVPEEYRETVKDSFASLTPQNPLVIYEHFNMDRLFRWKNRAVFNKQGELKEYFTVGEDITEYRAAEKNLRESETRNRALVNALPDLIFRYSKDGYYVDAEVKDVKRLTAAGQRLYREGQLIGSHIKDVLSPAMAKTMTSGISQVLKSNQLQVLEYSYSVEGKVRHHEARMVKSGPEEVMSIVRDITDRKIIEESLRYQLEFEKLVANISSAFVNASAGDIVDVLIDNDYLFTATMGRGGEIKVTKGTNIANRIINAIDLGERIMIRKT